MYLKPNQGTPFSNDRFGPPIWNNTVHRSWEGYYAAGGEAAYRRGGCLVTENKKGLQLFFYVPGVKARNLNVEVIDDVIHVTGNGTGKAEFSRSLSFDTDRFNICYLEANLKDGVLLVKAPRKNRGKAPFNKLLLYDSNKQQKEHEIEVTLLKLVKLPAIVAIKDNTDTDATPRHEREIGTS